MPNRRVVLDAFHLSLLIPHSWSAANVRATNRLLSSKRFHLHLRRTLETLLQSYPALREVGVRVSR